MHRSVLIGLALVVAAGASLAALRSRPVAPPSDTAPEAPRGPLADINMVKPPLPVLTSSDMRLLQENARRSYDAEQAVTINRFVRGNTHKRLVALTFDDGPHENWTLRLIAELKATHTPATFFLVGKQVDKFPELVQLEVLNGFEIGNHTYDHVDLTQIPPELIGFELEECDRAIRRATGSGARFFRPPGGERDPIVQKEAAKRHFVTALWTDDPGDYAKPGADVVLQRTLDHLDNGSIVLLHDGIPDTLSMLPTFIKDARMRGYEFVTLSQLAAAMGPGESQPVGPAIREDPQ
jgi:peptidoglycan/xylan/chitin deacetylase (PgdA/CDA1 family)